MAVASKVAVDTITQISGYFNEAKALSDRLESGNTSTEMLACSHNSGQIFDASETSQTKFISYLGK